MSKVYEALVSNTVGKLAPKGFKVADLCCINCVHCYDESSITACMKHGWFPVEWYNCCDLYDGGTFKKNKRCEI